MNYLALIIFGVMAGISVLREFWYMKEKKSMLNRVMSRNYQEFEYYDKAFKKEVKEMGELRDEVRDSRETEKMEEVEVTPRERLNALDGLEEDWDEDDIDMNKLIERTKE
jgi:hypothetical protein